jgi:hypothetical protein
MNTKEKPICFEPYLANLRQSRERKKKKPTETMPHYANTEGLEYTFSNVFLDENLTSPDNIRRPREITQKYGFRGHSKGGKNGVFYLRDSDTRLSRRVATLSDNSRTKEEIAQFLNSTSTNPLKPVKIVWHREDGVRVVGLMNEKTKKVLFLGSGKY